MISLKQKADEIFKDIGTGILDSQQRAELKDKSESALIEVRNEALEEAAKIANYQISVQRELGEHSGVAEIIRNLILKSKKEMPK